MRFDATGPRARSTDRAPACLWRGGSGWDAATSRAIRLAAMVDEERHPPYGLPMSFGFARR